MTEEKQKRIESWRGMEGKTIRKVIDEPSKERDGLVAVIVFSDDDWATLRIDEAASCDEQSRLRLGTAWDAASKSPTYYLTAKEQLAAGLVNQAQHDLLLQQEESEAKRKRAERAASLRRLADQLESTK